MSKTVTLESSIARLEEIVAALEGDISIDEAIDLAGAKLEAAKLKVEKLSAAKTTMEAQDESV